MIDVTDDGEKVVDFSAAKSIKEFVAEANERIYELEYALYDILETTRLDVCKEIAAEALHEDIEIYLESDDLAELDFDNDDVLHWEEDDNG